MKITRGVTRTVILTKKYAIKVPKLHDSKGHRAWTWARGLLANISEYDCTMYANTAYKTPQVCPVVKSYLGGIVNVYPRAEPLGTYDQQSLDELYDTLEFKTPSDVKPDNLGWWNGHFVWLDYDMNWNCREKHV